MKYNELFFFFKFNSNNNLKVFRGDLEDIERSAYELCQAGAEAGVIYQEVHYTPQFFLQPKAEFSPVIGRNDDQDYRLRNEMTAKDVVDDKECRVIVVYVRCEQSPKTHNKHRNTTHTLGKGVQKTKGRRQKKHFGGINRRLSMYKIV